MVSNQEVVFLRPFFRGHETNFRSFFWKSSNALVTNKYADLENLPRLSQLGLSIVFCTMTLIWIMLSLSSSSRIKSRNFGSYIINSVPSWTWTLSTLKCVMLFFGNSNERTFLSILNEDFGRKIYFVHFFREIKVGTLYSLPP